MQTRVCNCRANIVRRFLGRFYHADYTPTKPLTLPTTHTSLFPLLNSYNNLVLPRTPWRSPSETPYSIGTRTSEGDVVEEEIVVPFILSQHSGDGPDSRSSDPIGYVRRPVAEAIEKDHQKHTVSGYASPWDLKYSRDSHGIPKGIKSVAFAPWVNEGGKYTRTMHIERLVLDWRKHGMFPEVLKGWSDQAYPAFTHPPKNGTAGHEPLAFAIERAALTLFGLMNFGALLIAYTRHPTTGLMYLWIPRRSKTKRSWPRKLDVTIAGGLSLGASALPTILSESAEEALLDTNFVSQHIRPVGVLPSLLRSPLGYPLPGMYFLFDLPLPADGSVMPRRNVLDGGHEVDKFELIDVQSVLEQLLDNEFKPSSGLAIADFLVRHGYVTEETDPRYLEVCRLLKMDIELPLAWRGH